MGRPPLSVGTSGKVRSYRTASCWRSRTTYRDADGATREVERTGATKARAERALAEALRDRRHTGGGEGITGDTRVSALAKAWLDSIDEQQKSPTTAFAYRYAVERQVIPGLGSLQLRELTVARGPILLGGWRDPSTTHADLREAFREAGHPWATSHTFRKTVGTMMDESGLSARAAADQLGHAQPSLTMDTNWVVIDVVNREPARRREPSQLAPHGAVPSSVPPATNYPNFQLIFDEQFSTDCAEGEFLSKYDRNFRLIPQRGATPRRRASTHPGIISVAGGIMIMRLHTNSAGILQVCAPEPKINGATADKAQLYGRYEVRLRADRGWIQDRLVAVATL